MTVATGPIPPPVQTPQRRAFSGRVAWVVAGDCAVAALALALVLDGELRLAVVATLMAIAVAVAISDLVRRLIGSARSGALMRVLRTGALVVVGLAAIGRIYTLFGAQVVLVGLAAFVGLALMASWLVAVVERSSDDPSPWEELALEQAAAGAPAARRAGSTRRAAGAVAGAGLLLGAVFLVLSNGDVQDRFGLYGLPGTFAGVVLLAGLVALVAGPLILAAQAGARRDRELRDRASERQAVAAHLHDSVLQTLALIQRNATDSDKVVHLARQQERGLRSWLAGREESESTSLAAALRVAVDEVEDESGVRIDCVVAGDLPVDERTTALVRAAREALRNAARHAPGSAVRVFMEVDTEGAALFVRDTGGGFDPESIPVERRGVRDAIIGRMQHAGGSATIDSGPGGTEVVLRLPRRGGWS